MMLMPVQAEPNTTTHHLTNNVYVHVVRRVWRTFRVVVPHTHTQPRTEITLSHLQNAFGDYLSANLATK